MENTLNIRKLEGPHEGRTIMVDEDGDPINVTMHMRESRANSARVKCVLFAAVPVPVETVKALVADAEEDEVPEELIEALEGQPYVVTPLPLPFCSAQQPSDSHGVTIEFRLEMN